MKKLLLLSTLLFTFTGCVSTQEWLKTQTPSFQQGYQAGCDNGEDMAQYSYVFKNDKTKEYKENEQYRDGFEEGYDDCYTDKKVDMLMRF